MNLCHINYLLPKCDKMYVIIHSYNIAMIIKITVIRNIINVLNLNISIIIYM